jgi:hypothetical protein
MTHDSQRTRSPLLELCIPRTASEELSLVRGLFGFGGGTLNDEVIVNAKDPGGGVGLHVSNSRIGLVVDDPVEGNVPILHDDVNGMEAPEADRL